MTVVKHYPVNRVGRTFVVGDLHGCFRQFKMLLDAIEFDFVKDVMYGTGDLIDRGPQSKKCLQAALEPWFKPTAGNHELLLIEASQNKNFDWEHWMSRGGRWAALLSKNELDELALIARQLPHVIVVGEGEERFNVFHSEFHGSDAELDELGSKTRVPPSIHWTRDLFEGRVGPEKHQGLSPSFVGHSIVKDIRMIGSHIYIDTGSYMGERSFPTPDGMSVIEPATQRVWRVRYGKVEEIK